MGLWALPDDLGNEEEMGGREGRPPQPYFLYIDLSPLMINTKFHNGIKKGFDESTEKVLYRQGEGSRVKSTLLKVSSVTKRPTKEIFERPSHIDTHTQRRRHMFHEPENDRRYVPISLFLGYFFLDLTHVRDPCGCKGLVESNFENCQDKEQISRLNLEISRWEGGVCLEGCAARSRLVRQTEPNGWKSQTFSWKTIYLQQKLKLVSRKFQKIKTSLFQ